MLTILQSSRQEEFLTTGVGCSVSWPQCPEVFLGMCDQFARTDLAKVTAQLLETLLFPVSFHKTSSFF